MKRYFIINPAAGKGTAARLIPRIRAAAARRGVEAVVHTTSGPGEAEEFVRERCLREAGEELRFYACGGDGTAGEAARGLLGTENAALGVIPCGSGNDLVRSFPGRDFLDLEAQLDAAAVPLDLVEFCGRVAVNLCNCGLDANVAHNMPRFKRLPGVSGSMAYQLSIAHTFFHRLWKDATVRLDGGPPQKARLLLLVAANGQYYGGGYRGAPLAKPDDGLLDVCMVSSISRWKILGFLQKYQQGLHLEDPAWAPYVTYRQVRRVEAEFSSPVTMCLDGETFQGTRMSARILPGAARFLLPALPGEAGPGGINGLSITK